MSIASIIAKQGATSATGKTGISEELPPPPPQPGATSATANARNKTKTKPANPVAPVAPPMSATETNGESVAPNHQSGNGNDEKEERNKALLKNPYYTPITCARTHSSPTPAQQERPVAPTKYASNDEQAAQGWPVFNSSDERLPDPINDRDAAMQVMIIVYAARVRLAAFAGSLPSDVADTIRRDAASVVADVTARQEKNAESAREASARRADRKGTPEPIF